MFCENCGQKLAEGAAFCENCGHPAGAANQARAVSGTQGANEIPALNFLEESSDPMPAKPKSAKKKKWLVPAIAGAAVIIIAIIVASVTAAASGPLSDLVGAVNKLADKGEFDFSISVSDGYSTQKVSGSVQMDPKKKTLTLDVDDGNDDRYIIYEGYMINVYDGEVWSDEDISDELDELFDAYNDVSDLGSIDYQELFDTLGIRDADEHIDFKQLDKCLKTLISNLNSEKYMEENYSFETSKSGSAVEYTLKVKVKTFVRELMEILEPAILDDISDLDYSYFDEFGTVNITYTVEKGYLTGLTVKWSDHYNDYKIKITVSNIGSASLDMDEIREYYEEVY